MALLGVQVSIVPACSNRQVDLWIVDPCQTMELVVKKADRKKAQY